MLTVKTRFKDGLHTVIILNGERVVAADSFRCPAAARAFRMSHGLK